MFIYNAVFVIIIHSLFKTRVVWAQAQLCYFQTRLGPPSYDHSKDAAMPKQGAY